MCEGDGVEVADGGEREMSYRCPYCREKGFTVKVKLFTPTASEIVCDTCGETSRTREGFLFGGFAFLAFFGGAIGALWLTFQIGPYFSLAVFAVFLGGLFALGRLFAPLWRLDAPYRGGFKVGAFLARIFVRQK